MDSSFRQRYLKRFLQALNRLKNPNDATNEVPGSSRNIKLAADVSLALTANGATWSRALVSRISSDENHKAALRKIIGSKKFREIIADKARYQSHMILQSKLKQAHMHHHKTSHGLRPRQTLSLYRLFCSKSKGIEPATSSKTRGLVKRRTRQLQRLVPGGKSMETSCLLRETADYIASLTTQVEVLQSLLNSVNNNKYNQHPP